MPRKTPWTMQTTRKCSARSKRTGQPCGRSAILGGTVCPMHGGSAPQVKQAAADRLAALVDPALDQLTKLIELADSDSVKLSAIKDVLDRAGYKAKERIDLGGDVSMRVTVRFDDASQRAAE